MTAFKPPKITFTPIRDMSLKAMEAEYNGLDSATDLSQELRNRRAALCEAIKAAKRQQYQPSQATGAPAVAQA